jgi:hypothetical protein
MKISNREKVILGITALAAIWAGGIFLFSGFEDESSLTETNREEPREIVLEAAESLGQNSLTATEQAILEKAQASWPADPFIKNGRASVEEKNESPASGGSETDLVYNGYIEIGGVQLAIINGNEYAPGDRIAGTAFFLRKISAHEVLLADTDHTVFSVSMAVYPISGTAPVIQQSE